MGSAKTMQHAMPGGPLEPIDPSTALQLYLSARSTELAGSTRKAHNYRLGHFVRWCEQESIDNMNDLSGRDLHRYKMWRQEEGDLNKVTLKTQMDTLRVFIEWCESVDAVLPNLHEKVLSPTLNRSEGQREIMLEEEAAEDILRYLNKFHYASFPHVLLLLLWHTGIRSGTARAIDVEDYDADKELLHLHHRPGTDTPLKNGKEGERIVALSSGVCEVFTDWVERERPDVTDDHGREPFLASAYGRVHKSTIRGNVYRWTRPCVYAGDCPHDRDPDTCEAVVGSERCENACPSSRSPHAIRRGAITHWLTRDVPVEVVSDRMNVSRKVLDRHYDQRSEEVKVEQRRGFLDNV